MTTLTWKKKIQKEWKHTSSVKEQKNIVPNKIEPKNVAWTDVTDWLVE